MKLCNSNFGLVLLVQHTEFQVKIVVLRGENVFSMYCIFNVKPSSCKLQKIKNI